MSDTINLINWFDPYDREHIRAYKQLCATGIWPKEFLPVNVVMSPVWHSELMNKLATAWVDNFVDTKN